MKKLLITGCEGLLGQNLLKLLDGTDYEVAGCDLADASIQTLTQGFSYTSLNLTDRNAVRTLVEFHQPDVILNCAAMTAVDRCETEPELCYSVNSHAVQYLSEAAAETGVKLVQISTDYVFDGTAGPYRESDPVHPISVYGQSKLEGEQAVREHLKERGLVVRTVVLFGNGVNLKSSFITWLLSSLREGKPVRIVEDQISNVTLASDLARGMLELIEKDVTGVVHYGSRDIESRYSFAKRAARLFDLDVSLISPTLTSEFGQPAPRPLQGGFLVDKAEKILGHSLITIQESLLEYRDEMK